VIVTVVDDKDGEKHEERKVIVMSSDSAKWTAASTVDNRSGFHVHS
jgi:hypothetical protein